MHKKLRVPHNLSYLNLEENWMEKAQCYKEINENLDDHSALEDSKLENGDNRLSDHKDECQIAHDDKDERENLIEKISSIDFITEKQGKTKISTQEMSARGNAGNSIDQKTDVSVQNNLLVKDVFLTNKYCDPSFFFDEQEQESTVQYLEENKESLKDKGLSELFKEQETKKKTLMVRSEAENSIEENIDSNTQNDLPVEIDDFLKNDHYDLNDLLFISDEQENLNNIVFMHKDKCQTVQNLRGSDDNYLKDEDNLELFDEEKTENKTLPVQHDIENSKAKNSYSISQNNMLKKDDLLVNEVYSYSCEITSTLQTDTCETAQYSEENKENVCRSYHLIRNENTVSNNGKNNTNSTELNTSQLSDEPEVKYYCPPIQNEFSTQVENDIDKNSPSPTHQQANLEHSYSKHISSFQNKNNTNKKYDVNVKKKKYVMPCPSMKMIHEQTSSGKRSVTKKKESLIRNVEYNAEIDKWKEV